MESLINIFHYEFPLVFVLYLLIAYFVARFLKVLLKNNRFLFEIFYYSVVIHEFCHYLAALFCFKWPTYNRIQVEHKLGKFQISGSVVITRYSYSDLIYQIVNWDLVLSVIYLVWEVIASFVIGLAPAIFPLLFTYLLLSFWGQLDLKYLLLMPFYLFFGLVSNLSKEDILNAMPWIFIMMFIPMPIGVFEILISTVWFMFSALGISFMLFVLYKVCHLKRRKRKSIFL